MLITVSNLKQPKRPSAEEFINTQKHTLNYYSVMKEDKLHTRVDESYEHNWAMTNLDGILKSRNITLPTKLSRVKAVDFPVVMHGCESWTIKKAEHRRIDAFELWCWRRLLRVPWTARRSNQFILKETSPRCLLEVFIGCWAETPILWPPHVESLLNGKDPDAGRDWGQEDKGMTEDEMAGWHHWLT